MKTRKRGRSPERDCDECLPISKRITRLRIESTTNQQTDQTGEKNQSPCYGNCVNERCSEQMLSPWQLQNQPGPSGLQGNNNNLNCVPCHSNRCHNMPEETNKSRIEAHAMHHGIAPEDLFGYKPDLKSSDNPHYFEINKVLYEAHVQKAQRHKMEFDD